MKIIFNLFFLCLLALNLKAQAPEGIVYQAEARDNVGNLMVNESLDVKITIFEDSSDGTTVWQGLHAITTNKYGMFVLVIGDGEKASADFEFGAIDWASHSHFLNVQVKRAADKSWINMGTTQFLSVPYALHARTAEALVTEEVLNLKAAKTAGVPSQTWSLFGNSKSDPAKDKLGTTDQSDLVLVTNNEERLRVLSGGNINILRSLDVGEDLTVKQSASLNTESGETVNHGPLTVANKSKTTLTGDLQVNGKSQFDSDINVSAIATTNQLVVDSTSSFSTPVKGAIAEIRGLLVADSIVINGGLDIGGNLKVHGDSVIIDHHLNVGGETHLKDQVTIRAEIEGVDSDYDAYPLRIEGGKQGVAIKVSGSRTNANNYLTFWDSDGIQGRIEGQTTTELLTDPEYIFDNVIFGVDLAIATGEVTIATAEEVQAIAEGVSYAASENVCAGVGAVVCPPPPAQAVTVASNIALKSANLALAGVSEAEAIAEPVAYNVFKHTQIGVTYQSGAGDYAEWLPKSNPADNLYPGDIVGVRNGQVEHATGGAEAVLVVSGKPIVLGNSPEPGKENQYEKIAFMGQVPVKVYGAVKKGDFIVPSGNNDGYGKAVSAENLTIADCNQIVGIAWTSSSAPQLGYVNVAVGLNTGELAQLTLGLQKTIEKQADEIKDLKNKFEQMDEVLSQLSSDYETLMKQTKTNQANKLTANSEEQSVTYYGITDRQIEEGLALAREKLIASGVDVEKHPFFKKIATDQAFRQQYVAKIKSAYQDEISKKTEENSKKGIKTIVKDFE